MTALREYIETHPEQQSYNYENLFYRNDEAFVNFQHCNQILLQIQQNISNFESQEFDQIFSSQLQDLSDENLRQLHKNVLSKRQ